MRRTLPTVMLVLFAAVQAPAVEVQQELWGFDGKVVLGEFNPLNLYLYNADDEPFDAQLTLRKDSGGSPLGAPLVSERVFVSPGTGRWVTFYPFITSKHHEWSVSWGRGRDKRKDLGTPDLGSPAAVYLWSDRLARPPSGMRAFEAGRFPVTVGATEGLRAVVMDAVPQWDPPRRKAFLDWLVGGGDVHLLKNAGLALEFEGELAELNESTPTFRIGAGHVYRHDITRAEIDAAWLEEHNLVTALEQSAASWPISVMEETAFRSLQKIVRPDHNWPVIYLASVAFLLIVGPINGLLSRRRLSYHGSLLIVIAAVSAFSYSFYYIGRKGYGEDSVVHKIAYARRVSDGWDVSQYTNAFVTRGDRYAITHAAAHNLYSTAQQHESVRGQIGFAGGGYFAVDIPIYSWRAFVHRGTFAGGTLDVSVEKWPEGNEGLTGLSLRIGGEVVDDVSYIWALRGDLFTALKKPSDGVTAAEAPGQHYAGFLQLQNHRQWADLQAQYVRFDPYGYESNVDPESAISRLIAPLVASKLGVLRADSPTQLTGSDHIVLFFIAKAPDPHSITGEGFAKDHGNVIYRVDLFRPATGETP